ncbi:EamA family transporter [Patescibacteria group bacterium]|nr:EamA family transporter [Patescibacteria group bacterium]
MPFELYAWIATLSSGLVAVSQKLTSKHSISNPWLLNFFFTLFILVFLVPLGLVNHVGLPREWGNIFLSALFDELFWILFIISLYKLDISVISPLFNFRSIFSVFLGVSFLGEVLKMQQVLLIGLIIISGFFVAVDEKFKLTSFLKPAIGLVLTAMLALALNGFFINKAAVHNTFWQITVWEVVFSQLILILTVPLFVKDLPKVRFNQYAILFFIALLEVFYKLSANKAFSSNLVITAVIISLPASMIIAFLFSIFAPKLLEKHPLKVYLIRFIAAGLMIFASLHL